MNFDLPKSIIILQDSGPPPMREIYRLGVGRFLYGKEGTAFAIQRKENSLRGDSFIDEIAKKYNRKIVETAYSVIWSK